MKWEPKECVSGDMIRIRLGRLYHYGIFVSEEEVIQFGLPPTAENRGKEDGNLVLATDIDTFACGKIVETACLDRFEEKHRIPRESTVRLARARIGEGGYNIIHNNCEHFANECIFGVAHSSQADEARKRWKNHPICNVFISEIEDNVKDEEIFPEKRRAEIRRLKTEEERRSARFTWKLLDTAAKQTFGLSLEEVGMKRKLGGKWVCDKFFFSCTSNDEVAVAVVSNESVSVSLGHDGDVVKTLIAPKVTIAVSGKNSSSVMYFLTEDGLSELLSKKHFLQGELICLYGEQS